MYSSPKFFVPRTIGGLLAVDFAFPALATPAVIPIRSATPNETANAAFAARRVCFLTISPPLEIYRRRGPYALGAILWEAARWASASTPFVSRASAETQIAAARTP